LQYKKAECSLYNSDAATPRWHHAFFQKNQLKRRFTMKTKLCAMFLVLFLTVTALAFSQQPAGAKVWFSPAKATTYNVTKTYTLLPAASPASIEPGLFAPVEVTTHYVIDPPIKFHADTEQATRIMQFKVTLTYDSQQLTLEPANFSTSVAGLYLTATVIRPGQIEVQGVTYLDAGSPVNADKSLFQLTPAPQNIQAEPVTLQGLVNVVVVDAAHPLLTAESSATVVKALAKTTGQTIYYGDENGDGRFDINDALEAARNLGSIMIPDGTVFPRNLGDINQNGVVDVLDALLAAQVAAGIPIPISSYNAVLADVDFNNKVDIIDALLIVNYSIGKIANF
jgi:hypothetical protein